MHYYVQNTPDGLMMVILNEFRTMQEEYTVGSLFKTDDGLIFAQIVGQANPKPLIGADYDCIKERYDAKNYIYTIMDKDSTRYSFPIKGWPKRIIVAPTEQAAWTMLERLIGLDRKTIRQNFNTEVIDDTAPTKRKAIIFSHNDKKVTKYRDRKKVEESAFNSLDRNPTYFKGGDIGSIE